MSLVSSHIPPTTSSLLSSIEVEDRDRERDTTTKPSPDDTEATLSTLLGAFTNNQAHSMESGAAEYSQQSVLPTPYPRAFTDAQAEESTAEHASATKHTPQLDVRSSNLSAFATPTSEYPASARSAGSFAEHNQRQYHPSTNHNGSSGGMAQPTSPSMPLQDGRSNHHNPQIKSDQDVPIDPSIAAASSPTYPPHPGQQYSPYPPQQEMQHGYPQHAGGPMYAQPRPDWAGYGGHPQHGMPNYAVTGAQTPTSAAPAGARPGQVGPVYPYHYYGQVLFFNATASTDPFAPSFAPRGTSAHAK